MNMFAARADTGTKSARLRSVARSGALSITAAIWKLLHWAYPHKNYEH